MRHFYVPITYAFYMKSTHGAAILVGPKVTSCEFEFVNQLFQ